MGDQWTKLSKGAKLRTKGTNLIIYGEGQDDDEHYQVVIKRHVSGTKYVVEYSNQEREEIDLAKEESNIIGKEAKIKGNFNQEAITS